jgi:hypothetical protein
MPTEFDLFGFGEETEELWFVEVEEAWLLGGDFFGGVGGAQADYGIFVPEAGNEFAKAAGLFENKPSHFVGTADRALVTACKDGRNFDARHSRMKRV